MNYTAIMSEDEKPILDLIDSKSSILLIGSTSNSLLDCILKQNCIVTSLHNNKFLNVTSVDDIFSTDLDTIDFSNVFKEQNLTLFY